MSHLQLSILVLAKTLIIFYFLKAGINNLKNFKRLVNVLQNKRLPLPNVMMAAVVIIQIFGSLAILFDFYIIPAAIALIVFTMAANMWFCNYWTMKGLDRRNISFLFYANIAVIGGLLMVIGGVKP